MDKGQKKKVTTSAEKVKKLMKSYGLDLKIETDDPLIQKFYNVRCNEGKFDENTVQK